MMMMMMHQYTLLSCLQRHQRSEITQHTITPAWN